MPSGDRLSNELADSLIRCFKHIPPTRFVGIYSTGQVTAVTTGHIVGTLLGEHQDLLDCLQNSVAQLADQVVIVDFESKEAWTELYPVASRFLMAENPLPLQAYPPPEMWPASWAS